MITPPRRGTVVHAVIGGNVVSLKTERVSANGILRGTVMDDTLIKVHLAVCFSNYEAAAAERDEQCIGTP